MVEPEPGRGECPRKFGRLIFAACCERHRRRQSLGDILGEARAGKHGARILRQDFGNHLAEEKSARPFDAFGADHQRHVGVNKTVEGNAGLAHSLRRHGEKDGFGAGDIGKRGGRDGLAGKGTPGRRRALTPVAVISIAWFGSCAQR